MKPITTPIETRWDGMNSYQIESFTDVRNVPEGIPWNIFTELWDDVLKQNISIPVFDDKRNILHGFYLDYTCIEYTDPNTREVDKANNKERYELINLFQSKHQDEQGRQIARNVGEFEYNGKYYLVVSPRNTPLSDETIPAKWIFKGIIVNQDAYKYGIPHGAQWEVSVVKAQVLHLVG
jgi:hypothetical protein